MNVYAVLVGLLVTCSVCVASETGPLISALQSSTQQPQPAASEPPRQKRCLVELLRKFHDKLHPTTPPPSPTYIMIPGPGYGAPIYGPGIPPYYPGNGYGNAGYGLNYGQGTGQNYGSGNPGYGPSYGQGTGQGYGSGNPGYNPNYGQGAGQGYGSGNPGYGSSYGKGISQGYGGGYNAGYASGH